MANENQELQQQMEELRRSMQGLDASTKDSTKGLNAFGKELKTLPEQLAKGLGSFGKQLTTGDAGLKTFNTVIDTAANAAAGLAKTIPFAGEAISAAFKATADASKFLVDQLDQTAKSFNAMGSAGALTAKGMTGIREQFTRAGLSMQSFQKQVEANSETLAAFRGLTGEGADDFSKIVGDLTQGTDMSLRRLGMNAEQIAGTTAAFVKQQTTLGRAQTMSNEQLRQGTAEYAKELDLISKVTGMNREAIQKQQDAALSESRFRAVYEEELAAGNEKGAKAMMGFQTVMSGLDKELGQGLRDLSSGIVDSAAAQKVYNSTNGKAADIMERLKTGSIDQAQAQIEMKEAIGSNIDVMRDQARYNKDAGDTFIGLSGAYKLQRAQFDKNGDVMKEAAAVQKEQTDGADELTDSTIKAQKNLEKLAVETSRLATEAMPTMAKAVDAATSAMIKMFDWAKETLGGGGGGKANGGALGAAGGAGGGASTRSGAGGAVSGGAGGEGDASAIMDAAASGGGASAQGLRMKSGESTAGGDTKEKLLALAQAIQDKAGGDLKYFSAFNDAYHQGLDRDSAHKQGNALDFVLTDPSKADQYASMVKGMPGVKSVINEYAKLSAGGTGGHIHAEISAANGAVLSGPSSGYQPNLTMHGTEAVVPLNSPAAQNMGLGSGDSGMSTMSVQLDKLDEMISIMKNQLNINTKILQMQS
jgi:hypothetical protein